MAPSLHLLHREDFERRTLRALVGGAAMGLLAALAERIHLPLHPGFAVIAAALAGARPRPGTQGLLWVGVPLLSALPYLFQVDAPVPQALSGAIAAALVGWMGPGGDRLGKPTEVTAGAVAAGALVPLGMYVQQVLDARFFPQGGLLGALVGFSAVALFWSVGTLASHVTVHVDAVESRGSLLEDRVGGEAKTLLERTRSLYRQCQTLALKMPSGPGRDELVGVLQKMANESFTLAESHAELETQLAAVVPQDVETQVEQLRQRAAATEDAGARRQLELAASSLGEELNRLNLLARKRSRLLAQFHAQVALLERARMSLVGVAGTEASAKGAQAAHLAQRLAALGQDTPAPIDEAPDASPTASVTRLRG
ncbi:hypothetical protein POL68_26880 [Stigmatella sp. ncwal1]|uniref:FUSC family protein n=2 Tax=Stigmatella ashevillensis TaxID=2995309 RepID=A0ABT5DEN4_9BACT|nr:hypothetical protein [Stigmatella ashevillena]